MSQDAWEWGLSITHPLVPTVLGSAPISQNTEAGWGGGEGGPNVQGPSLRDHPSPLEEPGPGGWAWGRQAWAQGPSSFHLHVTRSPLQGPICSPLSPT